MTSPKVACIGEGMVVLVQEQVGPLENAPLFARGVGGAELNVAIGLQALGVDTAWLSRLGDDGFGRHIETVLDSRGVDISGIEIDTTRSTGLYVKERGGDTGRTTDLGRGRSRMHYYRSMSAATRLSPSYLSRPRVRALLSGVQIVHASGITLALSSSALRMMRALRFRTPGLLSIDANWRAILWAGRERRGVVALRRLLRSADIVFIGADEGRTIFGTAEPAELRRILARPRWLVVKDDVNVATGFDGELRVDVPAHTVDVIETIGAGDAFAAGFLSGIVARESLAQCLSRGHSSAERALRSVGDQA